MLPKPQLILDIGGVLITNLSPMFWQQIAAISGVSAHTVTERFKLEIKQALWTGVIRVDDFWDWLHTEFSIDHIAAQQLLRTNLSPLPAMRHLEAWSLTADIHLLSNHRIEWVMPLIEPVSSFISSITISSQSGTTKPNLAIFQEVQAHLQNNNVLFVDDQEKNMNQATALGWRTLLADSQGAWIAQVEDYLACR